MDEFESRLEHELSSLGRVPLAEPEPVHDLRRRARRVRTGRAFTGIAAVTTAALLVGSVAIALRNDSPTSKPQKLIVSAPSFVLGDIDAVVLSSSFDSEGARNSISPDLTATVAKVPGVQSVSGVIDSFAPVEIAVSYGEGMTPQLQPGNPNPQIPPRTPVLFSYHKDDEVPVLTGHSPTASNEIIVDADFLSRAHTEVGKTVTLMVKGIGHKFDIVGTFDLPGVDLAGIPLAAMSAAHQSTDIQLDRIDVKIAPGADAAGVRDAIATAVGSKYSVVQPSAISFPDQRLAQLEIQHAYWALLSPDQSERSTSGVGPPSAQESSNYAKYSDLAKEVELRVENVNFLSPDAASLTYRIYYGGSPSSIITNPQTGNATRVKGHWQLGTNTLCSLAALVGISCKGVDNVTISPPNGYQPVSTLDPEIAHAFAVLADPNATLDARVAALYQGDRVRDVIQAGLNKDQSDGTAALTIAGWRRTSANEVEILYSLTTTKGPSTPWPSTAIADEESNGHWYASGQYACGIAGLTGGGCYTGPVSPGMQINGNGTALPVATTSPRSG